MIEQSDVDRMRRRVFNYVNEEYDDDNSYAVDIMEDFLKMLGTTRPRTEADFGAPLAAEGLIASPASQMDELLTLAGAIDKKVYVTTPAVRVLARDYLRLREELRVTDELLNERNRLLALFDCPQHGPCVPFAIDEIKRLRAEVSSPARTQLAKIALADDIIEQVQRRYAGSGPLPAKGSTTVYADAQMVLAALAEGAVSAAPPGREIEETKDVLTRPRNA